MSPSPTHPGSPRLPYAQLPDELKDAVDGLLGSPVVAVSPRSGGFSPGPAGVVTCASGRRAFVKAVGTPLNPDTPDLLRAEARVAAAMPSRLSVPSFLGQVETTDGAWLALAFAEVPGTSPPLPWEPAVATRVLAGVTAFTASATPCPVPGLPLLAERLTDQLDRWPLLAADPPDDLDPWELEHLDTVVGVPARLAARGGLRGDGLVHLDLRADNLLLTDAGELVLLDWPWACVGPPWVDPVLLALDMAVHGGLDPAGLVAGLPAVDGADPRDVTDLLAGMLGMWGQRMRLPPPPGLPSLRAFQRRFHDATLDWVRAREAAGLW